VAAIHAGWRGLAAGVVAAGLDALAVLAGSGVARIAVIGPHIGPCCYEVDAPVLDALESRFADALGAATRPARPGRAMLDLALLVRRELEACGVAPESIDSLSDACTACHPERFHSFRRDGERAGRMQHYIAAGGARLPREA
jgi:copper oxidase (laccase) domain-containing protein